MLICVENADCKLILPKCILHRIKLPINGYFKYENISRHCRLSERCVIMEKIKKVMEKREMKMILYALIGITIFCVVICTLKLACRKKKRKKIACGEL